MICMKQTSLITFIQISQLLLLMLACLILYRRGDNDADGRRQYVKLVKIPHHRIYMFKLDICTHMLVQSLEEFVRELACFMRVNNTNSKILHVEGT